MTRLATVAVVAALTTLAPGVARAQSDTATVVRSTRVREVIRLQISGDALRVAVDERRTFPELQKDQTFLTRGPVLVTIYRLNPLKYFVSAEVTAVDDPSHATIARLVNGLLGAALAIRPGDETLRALVEKSTDNSPRASGRDMCSEETEAADLVGRLESALYNAAWSGTTVKSQLKSWSDAIDDAHSSSVPGPQAIAAALTRMQAYLDQKPATVTLEQLVEQADSAVRVLEAALSRLKAKADTAKVCEKQALLIYQTVALANPARRLADVKRILGSVLALQQSLRTVYADGAAWTGTVDGETRHDFKLLQGVEPTSEKMQRVTVKVSRLDYTKLDAFVPEVVARKEDLVTGTFVVRQYSLFVPEIGLGIAGARVTRREYGTGQDASGNTIVTSTEKASTVDLTVLVNFVSRAGWTPLVTPMFQFGVSTSKDSPALLAGGGIRLFPAGKGEVAVGAGWVLPWVKELTSLSENGPVKGTTELEADLQFNFKPSWKHWYWTIQYKF